MNLPYDIPANQFLNLEDQKISGSRNWAVWGLDFLSRYDPDPLRYYLTANMPEQPSWRSFLEQPVAAGELRELREAFHAGRPLGSASFLAGLAAVAGRRVAPGQRGRPRRNDSVPK